MCGLRCELVGDTGFRSIVGGRRLQRWQGGWQLLPTLDATAEIETSHGYHQHHLMVPSLCKARITDYFSGLLPIAIVQLFSIELNGEWRD